MIGPKRKPLESKPTTKSTSKNKMCSTIKSFIALNATMLRNTPNISLKIYNKAQSTITLLYEHMQFFT